MMRDILHTYSDWNDRLTPDVCHKWNKKCSEVNNALITVSRSLLGPVTYSQIATRLWVFADASKAAIAACAYIQTQESTKYPSWLLERLGWHHRRTYKLSQDWNCLEY